MKITDFFEKDKKYALGYSGGVDSVYLLLTAVLSGADIKPYFVKSAFTTAEECSEAFVFAEKLGVVPAVIEIDVLAVDDILSNFEDRCYHCKKLIFEAIIQRATEDGYLTVLEGTNASDDIDDRPGYKAIQELGVISPLKICGITKDMVRAELKSHSIDLWNKPSSACLATRIPCGTKISEYDLRRVACSEKILREMGFSDFRVRIYYNAAKIQVNAEQFDKVFNKHNEIYSALSTYFDDVMLDLKER